MCIVCEIVKNFQCFHKRSSMLDGYYNTCKACRKLQTSEYYIKNKTKIDEKNRIAASSNKEKKKESDRTYYEENKSQILANNKKYRELNCDDIKIQRKEYRKIHKDAIIEYKKLYYSTPNGKALRLRASRKRKALKRNQYHPLNNPEIEKQLELIKQRVENCLGIRHELDHVWPLSKGGLHHIANLRIIPKSINRMKNNNMNFTYPNLTMWHELPEWLISDIMNWQGNQLSLPKSLSPN